MPPDEDPRPPADEFLSRLLEAMRQVAQASRAAALEAARAQAARLIEVARRASALEAAVRQRRTDADVAEVAAWRDAEIARIRAEADQRLAARQEGRQREDAERGALTEREVLRVQAALADYEGRLDRYHAELEQIRDPALFVAAAARRPAAPDFGAQRAPLATVPARVPSAPRARTTVVAVAGHDSFGAVTSVKQALERVPGVSSVVLGLGDAGEFVLTTEHDPGLDLGLALRDLGLRGARVDGADGRLTLALGPPA